MQIITDRAGNRFEVIREEADHYIARMLKKTKDEPKHKALLRINK